MKSIVKPAYAALSLMLPATVFSGHADAMDDMSDAHAHHHHMMSEMKRATRTTAEYKLPKVQLVRDDGRTVYLAEELDDGRPVVLDFIYTSCTTICPVMSGIFAQLQTKLGSEPDQVHMVSISIDPEQDTPARLTSTRRSSTPDRSGGTTPGRPMRASRYSVRSQPTAATR
ncbi:MAG TPA: SCO family protein [Gemmatimonadales bacterium]|nr:SCO family protein [Gemmatimonadales bacterium]